MPQETKEQRFRRVAEARVNSILDKLRLLSQTANKNNYNYSDAQVRRIFRALRKATRETEEAFKGVAKRKDRFRL